MGVIDDLTHEYQRRRKAQEIGLELMAHAEDLARISTYTADQAAALMLLTAHRLVLEVEEEIRKRHQGAS